jgi:multicomponent Na+:H+ antiporter subunit C
METVLAIVVGGLFATGLYMLLRRSLVKTIIGLGLLGNASALAIFTSAGLTRGKPPLIGADETVLAPGAADPLPQALILTAIVITFGVQAFSLVLVYRAYRTVGTDDPDAMTLTDNAPREVEFP